MSFSVFIPARFDSTRFPGKPLIDLAGKPMIQRVYEQALKSDASDVYVATDDDRIAEVVRGFTSNIVMTSSSHETGTDRIYEAAIAAGLSGSDIVVNVQGDEPLMPPEAINQVATAIDESVEMSTLREPIRSREEVFDPNVVKVVVDDQDIALYFSRAPIPWSRESFSETGDTLPVTMSWYRHLGIYAYTMRMLEQYVAWPAGELEQTECLEQLRVIANGKAIRVLLSSNEIPPGIDVPEDVQRVVTVMLGEVQ
ncbi:MAG: 3-deoxy-manno-octulosonate cytidylyltransferase [Gammaproteobacteria bacterium]|nr:3-deoxy-manno-octulosonate cytidylyltransferase [Gammaproteobacteria bacterium]